MKQVTTITMIVVALIVVMTTMPTPSSALRASLENNDSFCHVANYDYKLTEQDSGYEVNFVDATNNAFVAWASFIWSTTISGVDGGSALSSAEHTIRLQRRSKDSFSTMLLFDDIKHILAQDSQAPFLLDGGNADQLKLKFRFQFWLLSEEGNRQELCETPLFLI